MYLWFLVSAALAAGLTIGLVSLNQNELILLSINGSDAEKAYAKRIIPLLEDYHTLIVSLVRLISLKILMFFTSLSSYKI